MKYIKVCADVYSGITECDDFDEAEVLSFEDFFDSLDTLRKDEIIGCIVSEKEYDILDDVYGVGVLPGDISRR
mgnify:FL=1